jgi:hypothetical protein
VIDFWPRGKTEKNLQRQADLFITLLILSIQQKTEERMSNAPEAEE